MYFSCKGIPLLQSHANTHRIDVYSFSIRPLMSEILFQVIAKIGWDFIKPDEVSYDPQIPVMARCLGIEPLDDGGHVTKYGRVHQSYGQNNQ